MKNKIVFFLYSFLSIVIGLIFVFSANSKLYPIEPFEFIFVDLGFANWRTAPFVARALISLEFFIGALFIVNLHRKKFATRFALFLIVLFNIYLIWVVSTKGNSGDCGCFGNALPMSPVQALIKNFLLALLILILDWKFQGVNYGRFTKWILTILFASSFVLPHILNYVDFSYSESYLTSSKINQEIPLDSLYKNATYKKPIKYLNKGKVIIAFMSLKCPHCKIAAKKIRLIKERNPEIPFFIVYNGDISDLKPFFKETGADQVPFSILLGKPFVFLAGTSLPRIYLLNNSKVEFVVNYLDLDQTEIEKWLYIK